VSSSGLASWSPALVPAEALFGSTPSSMHQRLNQSGIALLSPEWLPRQCAGLAESAEAYLSGPVAESIFQHGQENEDGSAVEDENGWPVLFVGTGQRKQAPLGKAPEDLKRHAEFVKQQFRKDIFGHFKGVQQLRFQGGVVIGNDPGTPGTPPIEAQQLHVDQQPGSRGYVVFETLSADATILVAPGSHNWVRILEARKTAEKLTEGQMLADVPFFPVVRLSFQPGQLLIMDGNLVHSGDASTAGQWTPRLHWYLQRESIDNVTYLITMIGGGFAARFGKPPPK
jgi:hypothetical protein